ncbi:MAG TPA: hypothetical protein VLE43_14550 [Candidatus Saccharimonadia bacterium]|nr:hypothetical protein [Candidatus Saccharimonadia bacterium]
MFTTAKVISRGRKIGAVPYWESPAMNYKVLTLLLLLVIGGIWLIDAPITSKPPSASAEAGTQESQAASERWHAAKDLSIVTWLGTYRVPRGAEVKKISDTEVEYQGRKFPIAKGDLMSVERTKQLSLRPALPPEVVERIAMIDAEIQDLRTEMQTLGNAARQSVDTGKGKGRSTSKGKSSSMGHQPSYSEANALYEQHLSALLEERQRLMTSR